VVARRVRNVPPAAYVTFTLTAQAECVHPASVKVGASPSALCFLNLLLFQHQVASTVSRMETKRMLTVVVEHVLNASIRTSATSILTVSVECAHPTFAKVGASPCVISF
jgi:hypothetical protein